MNCPCDGVEGICVPQGIFLPKCLTYKCKIVQFEVFVAIYMDQSFKPFYPLKFGVLLVANFGAEFETRVLCCYSGYDIAAVDADHMQCRLTAGNIIVVVCFQQGVM